MGKKLKKMAVVFAAALAAAISGGCGPSVPKLNVYMWSDYIDPDIVQKFEDENGCEVVISIFDSNESMYAKLKAGGTGYDVILPSSYMAKVMNDEKMIETLDLSKLPNVKNINSEYMKKLALDKTFKYSVPYMICYSCVAYDKGKCPNLPDTWGVFGDSKYRGRMTLLNDYRETIGAALKANGYSLNTRDDSELEKAKETLLKWKPNLARLDNEGYKSGVQSGEFVVVHGYSGDLYQVLEESKNLAVMIPKEGVSLSCDDWVIPADSKNKDLAYAFINYMCDPESAAANMEVTKYLSPVDGASKLMSDENAKSVVIPKAVYENGEMIIDLGEDNAKYLKIWDEIKISQ